MRTYRVSIMNEVGPHHGQREIMYETFRTKHAAQEWCDKLNKILGYDNAKVYTEIDGKICKN